MDAKSITNHLGGERLRVAVETPQHSGLIAPLDYLADAALPVGTLVRVPLGAREVVGVVWAPGPPSQALTAADLKPVTEVLTAVPPLSSAWCAVVEFAAAYYQRSLGEVALSVLPPEVRKLGNSAWQRRIERWQKQFEASAHRPQGAPPPPLTPEQSQVLLRWAELTAAGDAAPTALLHGSTGSGKTEVYLQATEQALAQGGQALILVPEINLTPQLEARFAERFADRCLVSLHSGLTPAQRLKNWFHAHMGWADVVLGTRLAVWASMPQLRLIVVDEEHDPSYKQQEGARYSARDLAVYRGRQERVPVLLGSATPSLESWQRAQQGRYALLSMPLRVGGATWPEVRVVDMNRQPGGTRASESSALSPPLLAAVQQRIEAGEQSLVFLNRRGYAPVLHCGECAWKSGCPHCSAWRVFHKLDRTLRCHHCGFTERVPKVCPDCGNPDIAPIGRGTEKLEEQLGQLLHAADGGPVRIARIDADSTRHKGSLETQLHAVHAGEVDVLVGTQMVTKGHDFRRITLVAAVNPDASLFSSDFRAPERLFALLMQAGGRAGRDVRHAGRSEMWVQTWHPQHPLYAALKHHDFEAFAQTQLDERASAGLPPYSHLALLRAEAKSADAARHFLQTATASAGDLPHSDSVTLYPPVPPGVARVANVERMHMLLESPSRRALQQFLSQWLPQLHTLRRQLKADQRILRWAVDIDPLMI
ncbi:MAG: primosomal protein N' [Pseudomonadota bacterium]